MDKWTVEVVQYDGLKVVRALRYENEGTAEKAERGLLRNLNVADYFTRIVPPAQAAPAAASTKESAS